MDILSALRGTQLLARLARPLQTVTTLLLADDEAVVSAYYAAVPGAQNNRQIGGYTFECDAELPDFKIIIAGADVVVPGSLINFAPNGGGSCYGGIQSTGGGLGFSILGDVFLKGVFAVFDQAGERMGFARQAGLGSGQTGGTEENGGDDEE